MKLWQSINVKESARKLLGVILTGATRHVACGWVTITTVPDVIEAGSPAHAQGSPPKKPGREPLALMPQGHKVMLQQLRHNHHASGHCGIVLMCTKCDKSAWKSLAVIAQGHNACCLRPGHSHESA